MKPERKQMFIMQITANNENHGDYSSIVHFGNIERKIFRFYLLRVSLFDFKGCIFIV